MWGKWEIWRNLLQHVKCQFCDNRCQVQPSLDKRAGREDQRDDIGLCDERCWEWKQRRGVKLFIEMDLLCLKVKFFLVFQFLFLSLSPLTSGKKDRNGRPMGNILATTRGDLNC